MEKDLLENQEEVLEVNLEGKDATSTKLTEGLDAKESYTKEELAKLIQSESDKRVEGALKTSKTKWLAEAEETQKEALRLATLSEEEKWKEELAQREQAVVDKELRIKQLELSEFATNKLTELKLPNSISKFVVSADEETTLANIQLFKQEFDIAINARLDAKLDGQTKTPSKSASTVTSLTKEEFNNLDYSGRVEIYNKSPELYSQLSNS